MPRLHWISNKYIGLGLLLATLLVGQWVLALHKSDLQAHLSGHDCEMCTSVGGLDDALPTSNTIELEPALFTAFTLKMAEFAYDVFCVYLSRAPPRSL
jgi:hypothetical protein